MPDSFGVDTLLARDVVPSSAFADLVEAAVSKSMKQLALTVRLFRGSEKDVLRGLVDPEAITRGSAVIVAGQRKLVSAVPTLMKIVRNEAEERDIVLRAIGSLVAIGDRRAASALIDAGRRKSSAYLAQIMFALAELGGREAQSYLFTLESGHRDPAVRKIASQALRELESRSQPTSGD